MKQALLASIAFVGTGLIAGPAVAASEVTLGAGGYLSSAYGSAFADEAAVAPVGENDESYPSSSFGDVRIGSDKDALGYACIVPPGGTDTASALSLTRWGADTETSTGVCGIDEGGDAPALIYSTPVYSTPGVGGFQLNLSYTPDGTDQRAGARALMPADAGSDSSRMSAYGTYSYEGDGWGVTAGAGASLDRDVEQTARPSRDEHELYQVGVNISLGDVAVGGAIEYYDGFIGQSATDLDRWVAGAGIAYTLDAWTFGAQYSRLDQESNNAATADEFQQDRVTLTGNYALGPGINIDGEVGYTWIDTDPEAGTVDGTDVDDYNALEIGIGTNFTF